MRDKRNSLLPNLVLLEFAHQRTANITSKNAYKHLENILNITKYISNSKLVNVEVQNINNKESYEEIPSQQTANDNLTILENIPFKRSDNITRSSHSPIISKSEKYIELSNFYSLNQKDPKSNNDLTGKSFLVTNNVTDSYGEVREGYLHPSTLSSVNNSVGINQIDLSYNNYISKDILINASTTTTEKNINEYNVKTKSDIANITLNVSKSNNIFIQSENDSKDELSINSNHSDQRSLGGDNIMRNNIQRETFNSKKYYKNEINTENIVRQTSASFDVTTVAYIPKAHHDKIDIKSNLPSEPHVPTFESDITNIKNSYAQNSFGEEGKPILTQNNVSFYFNDISSSVILSIGVSFAFVLILFVLSALWIIKRKKYHSKVYLSYELAKPRNRHISKPMPPSILPGEVIINNQSVSEIESPREPLFLQEEKITNLTLNKKIFGSMENCDSGIDNPAYVGTSMNNDQSFGQQIRPTLKTVKKEITRNRRSVPKYTKKRKAGADFPARVCSSDGSIFHASPSLTRCLVPPPPYSPSIRNESKLIFTLPTGNTNNSVNIDCESSH